MPQTPDIHIDLFAGFIFLGVMQGLFLSYFFLVGGSRKMLANRVLGGVLLVLALLLTEVFLGYSNYMGRYPWTVDFTEPLNYVIGPLLYMYVYTKIYPRIERWQWLHFVPFVFYFVYLAIFWHSQSAAFKYNGFINAFHPDQPQFFVKATIGLNEDPLHIRPYINHFTFAHFCIYTILSFYIVKKAFDKAQLSFWAKSDSTLSWVRKFVIQFALMTLVFILVKISFKNDLGDHIIAIHVAFIIYMVSFGVIRQSIFFNQVDDSNEKYQKSSLSIEKESQVLTKLEQLMATEKPFLDNTLSLPILAKKLAVSTHHLSQIINDKLKQNFFEMLASYRVQEAQSLLSDTSQQHLKIEEIAEMVGYNSKSAFNAAFKKMSGQTPSQYRKQHTQT